MLARHKMLWLAFCGLMAILAAGSLHAAPPTPPTSAAIPDYGARDSAPLTPGEAAPDPAAQAGRAVVALVIVLGAVVGAVYALKRFGWVTPSIDGKPSRLTLNGFGRSAAGSPLVTVESSQLLPGGAMLHVVSVQGKTLLLAATPHTVTTVAEWPSDAPTTEEAAAFEDYLARADESESGIAAANARLRSLLNRPPTPPKDTP